MHTGVWLILLSAVLSGARASGTIDYLNEFNYDPEEHKVVTEDGYVLTLFRMNKSAGTPILLMHGFLGTSDSWLLMRRHQNIATLLADKGYDVWIANMRGNYYSHEHVSLKTDQNNYRYWNFSAHEIATKDLPANIDFILKSTGREKLLYIGHSLGTTTLLMMCSEFPEHCEKIEASALLAPVFYSPEKIRLAPINFAVQWGHVIAESLRQMGIYEFLGRDQRLTDWFYTSCKTEGVFCNFILQIVNFNKDILYRPVADYTAAMIGGTSVRVYEHVSNFLSNDNSRHLNYRIYNLLPSLRESSSYNINNIKMPIALIYGEDDIFIDKKSINKLTSKLKNVVLNQQVKGPFKHMGFFYQLDQHYDMANNLFIFLKKYDSSL